MNKNYKIGFTLAEVLITLAIIGVVAALTIPSVISSYNDKKYNTARLKALKTFGEAGKMASINDEMNSQTNAADFVNNVLSKYLKITKVCSNAADCGFPSKIQPSNLDANKLTSDTDLVTWRNIGSYNITGNNLTKISATNLSTYLVTNDGFSAKLFYNPNCVRNAHENPYSRTAGTKDPETYFIDDTCMNVIYDMNGTKSPNHVGEDIGVVTVTWSGINTQAVAPGIIPYEMNSPVAYKPNLDAQKFCASKSTSKIVYSLPDIEELSSLIVNQKLTSMPYNAFWSGSPVRSMQNCFWYVNPFGFRLRYEATYADVAWCVRR